MKNSAAFLLIILGTIVGVVGASVGAYHLYAYLAPKYESTRRDVMINSRSYTEGTIRELYAIKRQYETANSDRERETLAAAARHEFSIFPKERLPSDLREFLVQIGG